jgi:hypothetical protein
MLLLFVSLFPFPFDSYLLLQNSVVAVSIISDQTIFFVAFRPESGPWPPLTRLRGTLIGLTTFGTTPLRDWSARHTDHYLTTLTKRETSLPPVGAEPTIPARYRPQTNVLDHAATGISSIADCLTVLLLLLLLKLTLKGYNVRYGVTPRRREQE